MKVMVPKRVIVYNVMTVVITFMGVSGGGGILASPAWAGCPNEGVRGEEIYAQRLPDCRAYEQVSPVEKNFTDAVGSPGLVQVSPSGDAVTFFSLSPFPSRMLGITEGAADFVTYLSARGEVGWETQGLLPPASPASSVSVLGLTPDLSRAIIVDFPSSPPPAEGATVGRANYYMRDNLSRSYQLLAGPGGEVHFAGATADDSRILFEDEAKLAPGALNEVPNLYELHDGRVNLVAGNAVAGPGGPALEKERQPGGATSEFYTQNTISDDGSRVFFSDLASGIIYVRTGGEQIMPVSKGVAYWRAATPDGRYVFFTEGGELYRYAVESGTREVVGSGVVGTLGISDDGSYVYYVVNEAELYEWHNGATTLITRLNAFTDKTDWLGYCLCNGNGSAGGEKSANVASTGSSALFSSNGQIFVFNAVTNILACVSCNANGVPAYFIHDETESSPRSRNPFIVHNLSDNGDRAFFQTEAALVPQDTNGKMDVYEWEREGSGSCLNGEGQGNGSCLYLISTGESESESYFGGASASGDDVFFFTRESLVRQDQDNNVDIYDARARGGITTQNRPSSLAPCIGEACRGATRLPPAFALPSTAVLSGLGNLMPKVTGKPSRTWHKRRRKGDSKERAKRGRHVVKGSRHRANRKHRSLR